MGWHNKLFDTLLFTSSLWWLL